MSFVDLQKAVLAGAQKTFNNPQLRTKDMIEWNTGEISAQQGEVVAFVEDPGVYVCISKSKDKRK